VKPQRVAARLCMASSCVPPLMPPCPCTVAQTPAGPPLFFPLYRASMYCCHVFRLQGKSTLTNYVLGDERCLTGPEPGLTRDAIKTRFEFKVTAPVVLLGVRGMVGEAGRTAGRLGGQMALAATQCVP